MGTRGYPCPKASTVDTATADKAEVDTVAVTRIEERNRRMPDHKRLPPSNIAAGNCLLTDSPLHIISQGRLRADFHPLYLIYS
jgi:hypothetical protein